MPAPMWLSGEYDLSARDAWRERCDTGVWIAAPCTGCARGRTLLLADGPLKIGKVSSLWRVEDAEPIYRPTRDLDLLAVGDGSAAAFCQLRVEVLSVVGYLPHVDFKERRSRRD